MISLDLIATGFHMNWVRLVHLFKGVSTTAVINFAVGFEEAELIVVQFTKENEQTFPTNYVGILFT